MIRRISTKWILTVLAAVMLPFLGFAWFVDSRVAERHWDTVRYYLLTTASEVADRVDNEIRERTRDVELYTKATPIAEWTITGGRTQENAMLSWLTGGFNRFVARSGAYDLILAINDQGELVVSNTRDAQGAELPPAVLAGLDRDYSREEWFQRAMRGEVALVDHHVTSLLPPRVQSNVPHPENFHVGFAVPVRDQLQPGRVAGVVYALMNWSPIQNKLMHRTQAPTAAPDIYRTSYVWLWGSDCDTILAHPVPNLYAKKVSEPPIDLPQLVTAARASDWAMYPEYRFRGEWKNAAFKKCASPAQGGFGWVVGVGIDNDDIYATVRQLRIVLWSATGLVLSLVVLLTIFVARRTTRPILDLKSHAQKVATGDLDARIERLSDDELGDLGRAFNQMTADLRESRTKLIKAEKDAAWREMARQVAHEIKNPLTPIRLSANLLKRAKDEKSPHFDAIFERTIELIGRQVESMRKIAADFSAFAGTRKPHTEVFDLADVVREVAEMNVAWAEDQKVAVTTDLVSGRVSADRNELRRVLINLVSNAIEAMPQGGRLDVRIERRARRDGHDLVLEVRDTGAGLSDTVRARLFEPYFTTRTHGTGLGLAIAKRLVEEMNGRIELEPRTDAGGPGTVARVTLPEASVDVA